MFPLTVSVTHSGTTAAYVIPPVPCRVVGAYAVSTVACTVADATITVSDGTTTVGKFTIAHTDGAIGDCDTMALYDVNGSACSSTGLDPVAVAFDSDTPIKVVSDGASTAGAVYITLICSEFHGA